MGKYDISAELTNDCKLTVYDLAKEIDTELELDDTKAIEMKLGNGKSGLLKKLKDILKFDVEEIAKDSEEEQFQMYKLLKELYLIEKYGRKKYVGRFYPNINLKIKIIDILAKPRLSNIKTYYSEYSEFGTVFDKLFSDICSIVEDSNERIRLFESIESYWQNLSQYQYNYVAYDSAMGHKKETLTELNKINEGLNRILTLIDNSNSSLTLPTEGVMGTFLNILLTYKRLCYEEDRIRLFNYINYDFHFNTEYTELFKKYEEMAIDISSISTLEELLSWAAEHECQEDLIFLLSYGEGIVKSDYRHYDYAIKHSKTVFKWLQKEKVFWVQSDQVYLALFLSIILEVVYTRKFSNVSIRSDFYGYKNVKETLTSPFAHPEKEPVPAIIDVWIRRIETRYWANYGLSELITEKNKAEVALFRIKKYILSFRNIQYLKVAQDFLFHKAAVCHINCNMVNVARRFFEEKLAIILKEKYVLANSKRSEERFRELLSVLIFESYYKLIIIQSRVEELVSQIAQCVYKADKKDASSRQQKRVFVLHELEGCRIKYKLKLRIEMNRKTYSFQQLDMFKTEQEMAVLNELGFKA